MVETRKFMFDVDFDEPEIPAASQMAEEVDFDVEPEPVVPPAPTFSEEELAAARDEAYAIGHDDGMKEAVLADEHRIADAVELLSKGFRDLSTAQDKFNETTARLAVALAVAMTRKMLPETARRHGTEEVAAVVAKVLPHILEQPRVFVRAAPELVEPLRSGLTEIADANGFEGRLLLVADEVMRVGDCRIEWADGGAERDMGRMWREIEQTILNNGGAMPPDDEDLPEASPEMPPEMFADENDSGALPDVEEEDATAAIFAD